MQPLTLLSFSPFATVPSVSVSNAVAKWIAEKSAWLQHAALRTQGPAAKVPAAVAPALGAGGLRQVARQRSCAAREELSALAGPSTACRQAYAGCHVCLGAAHRLQAEAPPC